MVGAELVSRVRDFRQKAGQTQEQFARDSGVTRQTIIAIEKGNYQPSILLALKIAGRLGAAVEELFQYG